MCTERIYCCYWHLLGGYCDGVLLSLYTLQHMLMEVDDMYAHFLHVTLLSPMGSTCLWSVTLGDSLLLTSISEMMFRLN